MAVSSAWLCRPYFGKLWTNFNECFEGYVICPRNIDWVLVAVQMTEDTAICCT